MAKGYLIGHITVKNPEGYKEYIEKDTPILKGLGAKFIVRGGHSEVLEGEAHARHVVIEFESYDAALKAYNDPEYQTVADIRYRNAESTFIVVEGVD
ncbi:MAG: DUF1330 domain-containing protein [Silicimonas sp.]|nr:DUF1330 domain-containing protein [Silicimonas sp.]